jgi:glutathione S-transferase
MLGDVAQRHPSLIGAMRIYTSPHSPFGARVTIAARAKGVVLEPLQVPNRNLLDPAFLAINPFARIPVLVLEDGTAIPESAVILKWLEERFPTPSLMPTAAGDRATIRTVMQAVDLYVAAPLQRLFPHFDPARRDAAIVEQEFTRCHRGLAAIDELLGAGLPVADAGITLADCVLAPSLHLCVRVAARVGIGGGPVMRHPRLADWYGRAWRHPIIGAVLAELTEAQVVFDTSFGMEPVVGHPGVAPTRGDY